MMVSMLRAHGGRARGLVRALSGVIVLVVSGPAGAQAEDKRQPGPPPPSGMVIRALQDEAAATVCLELARRRNKMREDGVADLLARGPEWARTQATREQIETVRTFIDLQERVMFRCPSEIPEMILTGAVPPMPERRPPGVRARVLPKPAVRGGNPIPLPSRNTLRL